MLGRKAALAALSILLLLSMGGGFLLLPLLVPLHVWAARRSGPVGRVGWSVLPAAATGSVVWAVVYVTLGEAQPWIWLLPIAAAIGAVVGMLRFTTGAAAPSA